MSTTYLRPAAAAALVLFMLLALGACRGTPSPSEERALRASDEQDRLVVGAAWPWERRKNLLFRQGMELAVEQVNGSGGAAGREVQVVYRDDRESIDEARLVAQRFAGDTDVVAVIGHLQSFTTLAAAAIYDRAGLLLIAPSATDGALTRRDYPLVFQATLSDDALGQALADHAAQQQYERAVVCYVASEYGRAMANAFERRAADHGIEVVERQPYEPSARHGAVGLRELVTRWKDADPDVIFLAGEVPEAAMIIARTRAMGVTAPILGGDAVGVPSLIEAGGSAVEGTVVASRFHPEDPRTSVQEFVAAFRERFGVMPDVGAASAYDAVHLLAHAVEHAGSHVPAEMARALRQAAPWEGVLGPYEFDEAGKLLNQAVRLEVVDDGRFVPLRQEHLVRR